MNVTPRHSFKLSPSSSTPLAKDVICGRFIPQRESTAFRTLFHVAPAPSKDSPSSYSRILQNQLCHSSHKVLRFAQHKPMLANKENAGLASPLTSPAQDLPAFRAIPKTPYKVLDAPQLQDDFYLNVLDWSSNDLIAVGLNTSVYLWSTKKIVHLADYQTDAVASVAWAPTGPHLGVGLMSGKVLLYDVVAQKTVRTLPGHQGRVGTLSWNKWLLSSGSRDKSIIHRDLRDPKHFSAKLSNHSQEVCGLKWDPEGTHLASGGNDNKLVVWSSHSLTPLARYDSHVAAVKAIAWSPHQHGLLVSGGGTADKSIRYWDTLTNQQTKCVYTDSQVCNLMFAKTHNELVSTHGYSHNQVIIWKSPSMEQCAALMGHVSRVLYLAMSPDSETIVTGAGDETLRFWKVFPSRKTADRGNCSLFPTLQELR